MAVAAYRGSPLDSRVMCPQVAMAQAAETEELAGNRV
jgi:hypothetical protein